MKGLSMKVSASSHIRLRAIITGVVLIPIDNYWVIWMEKANAGPYPTIISIFANVVFFLAVLALLNSIVRRVTPRLAFSTAEMLVIYTMLSIGASLAGHDMIPSLIMHMGHPWRFASPENNWADTFIPYLPKWLMVSDTNVLKGLYEGRSSLYTPENLSAWLGPVINWTIFVIALIFVMMCINTLVRKQWIERERLTFPIVQLPLAMTEPRGAIWRNKLFWIGFAIAFAIDFINGLATYYPNVPTINVGHAGHNLTDNLTSKPWNAMGWTPYTFHPFVIGLGYLLPADLSFSCWFFYWFWKAQLVVTSAMAWDAVPEFPYIRHQAFGGYVAIILTLAWTGRGYLKQVWLRILGRKSEIDDSDEPISYRAALAGAVVGFVFLSMFMKRIGLSPVWAVVGFAIYFVLSTAIARMRAELGPPVHDLHFSGPDYMIPTSVGLGRLSNSDLVGLTYFYWFNRAYRGHPMPIGIEGMKMAQVTRSSQRSFFWAVIIAAAVGSLASFWAYLHLGYTLGLSSKFKYNVPFAWESFNRLSGWWTRPLQLMDPNWGANLAMVGGFGFCVLLA
ncbi:MAG: hypothetical protein N3B12_05970, partial [Armatimonadetes bacterium]|nr:hypothetical protein [Armatimonadota bacterium]